MNKISTKNFRVMCVNCKRPYGFHGVVTNGCPGIDKKFKAYKDMREGSLAIDGYTMNLINDKLLDKNK